MNYQQAQAPSETILAIPTKFFVSKDLYDFVDEHIKKLILTILPGDVFSLEEIWQHSFWPELSVDERWKAEYCMIHLVEDNSLPFEFVGCKHAYPQWYKLKCPMAT